MSENSGGAVFWLEVLGKSGEILSRHKFFGSAHVGRGYDNDLVIDDPYVAARHLTVSEDESGHLWAEDLGSLNGSVVTVGASGHEAVKRLLIADEANLTVGRTHLRIRTTSYVVPPELPSGDVVTGWLPRNEFHLMWLALLVLLATGTFFTWLNETGERKYGNYMVPLLMLPFIDLVWAGTWALVTRIVTSHARFVRHVLIVLTAEIVFFAADKVARFFEYSLAWNGIGKYETPVLWILFAGVCFLHLRLVVPRRPRLIGLVVSVLAVLAVTTQWVLKNESEKQVSVVRGASTLLPPFMRVRPMQDPADFFRAATALQPQLDIERKKEPAGGPIASDAD